MRNVYQKPNNNSRSKTLQNSHLNLMLFLKVREKQTILPEGTLSVNELKT